MSNLYGKYEVTLYYLFWLNGSSVSIRWERAYGFFLRLALLSSELRVCLLGLAFDRESDDCLLIVGAEYGYRNRTLSPPPPCLARKIDTGFNEAGSMICYDEGLSSDKDNYGTHICYNLSSLLFMQNNNKF